MWWLLLLAVPPAIVAILYYFPIRIYGAYDELGLLVQVFLGPLKFHIYPDDDQDKLEFETVDTGYLKDGKKSQPTKKKKGGLYKELLAYLKFAVDILDDLRQKIRIKDLSVKIIQAGEDPYDLAMKYGKAWTMIGNLTALIDEIFTVKKRDLAVDSDFLATETCVRAHANITITLGRFIRLYIKFAKRYYSQFNKILIIKKGGASK